MLRFFSAPVPPTRFETHTELNKVTEYLNAIRNKKLQLENAKIANGAGSADFAKHIAITRLLNKLDDEITRFNQERAAEDQTQETRLTITLINHLENIINQAIDQEGDILFRHRNGSRNDATTYTTVGLAGTALTAAYFAPASLLIKAGIAYSGMASIDPVLSKLGLRDSRTKTEILLDHFRIELYNIKSNLALSIGEALPNPLQPLRQQPPQPLANEGAYHLFSISTQSYLDAIRRHQKASEKLAALNLSESELNELSEFLDPITDTIMNTPVLLAEKAYDVETLLRLPLNDDGYRKNPFTNELFLMIEIQPLRELFNKMHEKIDEISRQHLEAHGHDSETSDDESPRNAL